MKILLDHCIDWRLKRLFPSHAIKSTQEMGWEDLQNGKLLAAAGPVFDLFLTADQNIKNQQNLATLPIAIFVLISKSNRLDDLSPLAAVVEQSLLALKIGQLVEIRIDGTTVVVPGRERT